MVEHKNEASCTRAERALLDMIACWPGVPARVTIFEDGGYTVATSERHLLYAPDPQRAYAAFAPDRKPQAVSHNRAEMAACRLIHSHFGRDEQVHISKPARAHDDDFVLLDYIWQQRESSAPENDELLIDLLRLRSWRTPEQDKSADEEEQASRVADLNIRLGDNGLPALGQGNAPLDQIYRAVEQASLLHRSGGVLLSPENTLRKSSILFMGLNPGGDESEINTTLLDNLFSCRMGRSSWEEDWNGNPGEAPLQRRFKQIAEWLQLDPLALPATNIVFTRSRNVVSHKRWEEDRTATAEVHTILADTIQPEKLWIMGNPHHAGELLTDLEMDWRPAKHGNWSLGHGTAVYAGRLVKVCHTPHLSRWDPEGKEEELRFAFGL